MRWVILGVTAILLLGAMFVAPVKAVDKLDIELESHSELLPYGLASLHKIDFGGKKLPVHNPVEVLRPQRTETDSAYVIHAFNSDIFTDNPAIFSLKNATFPEVLDHDPVYINLNCFNLYHDELTDSTAIIAAGFRNDSAYVLKSYPGANEFDFLFLATGTDLTGDKDWRGVTSFSDPVDYDFDGRVEVFCYVDPGRDLRPRLLCCVELATMTLEWSLPAAAPVTLHQLYPCGDSADPEIMFTTYNYKNGVEDDNFSDMYCYLTRVDSRGQIKDNRIISVEHGSKGLWRGFTDSTFFLFHALPLVDPDSITPEPKHRYRLSKIDREFNICKSLALARRVREAWQADYREDGTLDLYVLFHGGTVHIYDSTLTLLAQSGETNLNYFVDKLKIGPGRQTAYVFNTSEGMALYSHDFDRLAQFDAPVRICYPLKYGPRGEVEQLVVTHQNAYLILQLSYRSIWDLAGNIFHLYQVYILAVILVLLLLVVWSNIRRLRSQRQLLETRHQLRSVFRNINDVVYRTDNDGILTWLTPSATRLLGYERTEDMTGRPLKDLYVHPEDRNRLLEELEAKGFVSDYEVELRHRDGSTVTISTSSSYWRDKAGNIMGVEGVVRDITARKKAEEDLRRSEEKYRNLFDRAQVGMYRTTLDGSAFLAVNRKMAEIYGGTIEELLAGPSITRWANPSDRQAIVDRLKQDGLVTDYEIAVMNKQGQPLYLLVSARLYPEEDYIEGSAVDITERKKALAALTESERRYETLTESSPDGIMAADPATMRIVFVNMAMSEMTGYRREELLSFEVGGLSDESEVEEARNAFEQIVRGRTNKLTGITIVRKDRSRITVDIRAVQAEFDGRTVILGFFRDVTELRQKELLLRQRTASLKRLSNRLIDLQENDRKFIARELHDTVAQNLALSKIKLETALLTSPAADNGAIKEASSQVTRAIDDLKNISAELRPHMLDELGLGPTMEWYLKSYASGLKVKFASSGQPIKLDPNRQINLFRVFQELILNMKKHSGADRISVSLEYAANRVTLTVEDNGRGFDLDKVTNNWASSSTFGLMNITERVEIVGGEFTINTGEGEGATFVITIPGK